jgi:hypothetical protein
LVVVDKVVLVVVVDMAVAVLVEFFTGLMLFYQQERIL